MTVPSPTWAYPRNGVAHTVNRPERLAVFFSSFVVADGECCPSYDDAPQLEPGLTSAVVIEHDGAMVIRTRGPGACPQQRRWYRQTRSDEPIESVITRFGSQGVSPDARREQRHGAGQQEQRRMMARSRCPDQRVDQRAGHRITGEEQQVHLVLVDRATPRRRWNSALPWFGLRRAPSRPTGWRRGIIGGSGRRIIGGFAAAALARSACFDELSCRKVGSTEQHTIDVP